MIPCFGVERPTLLLLGADDLAYIVCANKDRQHIGFERGYIPFPAFMQVAQRVTADTPIEELVFPLGIATLEVGSAEEHETMAVEVVQVLLITLLG